MADQSTIHTHLRNLGYTIYKTIIRSVRMPDERKTGQDTKQQPAVASDVKEQKGLISAYHKLVENIKYPDLKDAGAVDDFNQKVWHSNLIRLALTMTLPEVINQVRRNRLECFQDTKKNLVGIINIEPFPDTAQLKRCYQNRLVEAAQQMQSSCTKNIQTLQLAMQHDAVMVLNKSLDYQGFAKLKGRQLMITRQWIPDEKKNIATSTRPKNRGIVANWSVITVGDEQQQNQDHATLTLYAGGTALIDADAKSDDLLAYIDAPNVDSNFHAKLKDAYGQVVRKHAEDWASRYKAAGEIERGWMLTQLQSNPVVLRLDSLLTDAPAIQFGGKAKEQNMVDFFKCLNMKELQTHLSRAWKSEAVHIIGSDIKHACDHKLNDHLKDENTEICFPVTVTPMDTGRFLTGIASVLSWLNPKRWFRRSTRAPLESHEAVAEQMLDGFASELEYLQRPQGHQNNFGFTADEQDPEFDSPSNTTPTLATFIPFLQHIDDAPVPDISPDALKNFANDLCWSHQLDKQKNQLVRRMQAAMMLAMTLRQQKKQKTLMYAVTLGSILVALGLSIGLIMMGMAPMIVGMALVGVLILSQLVMMLGKRLLIGEWDRKGFLKIGNWLHWVLNARFLLPGLAVLSMSIFGLALGVGPVGAAIAITGLVLGFFALLVGLMEPKYDNPKATLSSWMSILSPTFTGCKTARDRMGIFVALTTERFHALQQQADTSTSWQASPYFDANTLANSVGQVNMCFLSAGAPFAAKMGGNLGIKTKTDKATKLAANVHKLSKFKGVVREKLKDESGYNENSRFSKNLSKLTAILSLLALALFAWQMAPVLAIGAPVWAMVVLSGLVVWSVAAMLKMAGVPVPYHHEMQFVMALAGTILVVLHLPVLTMPITIAMGVLLCLMAVCTLKCRKAETYMERCTMSFMLDNPLSPQSIQQASKAPQRPASSVGASVSKELEGKENPSAAN